MEERAAKAKVVEAGVLCARCGYDLCGLRANQRCPECGGPIANSLRAELLAYAAPEFVRRLYWGARLAQVSAIGGTVALGGTLALLIVLGILVASGQNPAWLLAVGGVVGVLGPLGCGATGLAGWWLLTARDPGAGGVRKDVRVRRVIRVSVVATGVCWMFVCVPPIAGALLDLPPAVYIPLTVIVGLGLVGSTLTLVFASAPFVKGLGARLEDDRVGEMASTQTIIAGLAAGACALMGVALLVGFFPPGFLVVPALVMALMVYHALVMRRVSLLIDEVR